MALLLSLVGGLGLMGTMSLNVLERSREIGVMRAIGTIDLTLMQVILGEASLIGVISWFLGCLLAFPLSKLLNDMVGLAVMQTPFIYTFSAAGALAWLVIVLLLAYVACLIPARQACRLTVREVLAYE